MRMRYDVIVVGGGHAGVEAASAAARRGARTLLLTPDLSRIGQMSCNPAIGGVAKGVVAREIDAMGGVMGRATDASRIQFRMLNRGKGPAVWGPRAQCDRALYPRAVRRILDAQPRLELFQDLVDALIVDGKVRGVQTRAGLEFEAPCVVVTAGTFLRGRIHVGGQAGVGAGRAGEGPSVALAESLEAMGLEMGRFKTGTPPRIDGRTVDFSRLQQQDGDPEAYRFAHYAVEVIPEQRPCWITWTGTELRDLIRANLTRSALYGGAIGGQGPRYCPSIEDKVVRFPEARRHQVFLEPEGLETNELYVNGLSTSLPADVQAAFVRSVPGLEEARLTKLGYAIEYDYFPPHQLRHTLELREIPGLFFAGQINGTTGYEEAAGQGLVAGANAAANALELPPLLLGRDEAYTGVLVDDLVTKGVDEPYRLFTSRAEFRLLLRQDNAAERLGAIAGKHGLLDEEQRAALDERRRLRERVMAWFRDTPIGPEAAQPVLDAADSARIHEPTRASELIRRPRVGGAEVALAGEAPFMATSAGTGSEGDGRDGVRTADILAAVEVELKYEGYVERERARAEALRVQARFALPEDFEYSELLSLSTEAREKLARVRPHTLAQAGRVPGVTPADLQNLVVEVRRRRRSGPERAQL